LGIALATNQPDDTVNYTISGQNCSANQIYVNNTCQDVPHNLNAPVTGNVAMGTHAVYAKYNVSSDPPPSTVTFAPAMNTTTGKVAIMSEIYASYMSTPTRNSMNITGPVSNPLPGEWNILYYITTETEANYTINPPDVYNCPNNTVGMGCSSNLYPVSTSIANPAAMGANIYLPQGSWNYYAVNVTSPDPFWVSVYASKLTDFELYVRKGAVPVLPMLFDINGCNVGTSNCGYATIINLNNTANSLPPGTVTPYYVGIQALQNVTYTIWWSSTCSPLCITANDQESGVCSYSGNNLGQCSCEDGFMGFDCSLTTGNLPTQYIVLIIIASLVVLSALIGFFAWAYMQRKREGYSSLS
jgi:hypothetical protein